ncbi:hypothetical protein [Salinibacter ruber]|uniref:hypothetical protein n=1 Tax=Salinibacter ruber TaxID=146919 RepID=UPI002169BE1C|nr:hypothetical protein [Salinibacter ruber]MCS3755380.1 hypothetical protein [Salinibacter ruber]MCS3955051.1 hypothetical protein [Salinibacter ruber]MCS4085345.1 hypothetical protein [Salinibacter ruber]
MAYTYDLHPEIGILLIRNAGDTWTGEDILASAGAVVSDERMEPSLDWVYDLRTVQEAIIGVEDMECILERFSTYRAEGRVASSSASVIVRTEDVNLHLTPTLYKHRAGRPEELFEVVQTLEAARQYLGIQTADWDAALTD